MDSVSAFDIQLVSRLIAFVSVMEDKQSDCWACRALFSTAYADNVTSRCSCWQQYTFNGQIGPEMEGQ